ncbi:MAG: type VI secretion system baseplate subunit TssF [Gammaproteobacteria bacterium]|nr:type VI secretion system baseplate subunit TssF [Gammaproteobacteria bacterium]
MNKYYQAELEKLREQAVEFSQAYPTIAPQLAQASTDPDVERILEGVAFLSAQIRQKIDDDFPEFAQGLLKQIFPHYLRPVPSATIVKFSPKDIMKNNLKVPKGVFIDSAEIGGVSCRFSTVFDMDVWPLSVTNVRQSETAIGKKSIEIDFSMNGMSVSQITNESLRLHLGGDYHGAVELFYVLMNCVDYIELQHSGSTEPIRAENIKITPVGFEDDQSLIDYPSNSFPAYRLIQEYFILKEKFLFIDIENIKQYLNGIPSSNFTIKFFLSESVSELPRLNTERFILHATPAVNLFKRDAESMLNDHKRSEYRLLPLRDAGKNFQIYSVDEVTGQNRRSGSQTSYREIGLANPDLNTEPVYQINHRQVESEGSQVFISFSYPKDFNLTNQETLAIQLTCSNGDYPSKLKPGDISKPTSSTSDLMTFGNIIQPSEHQNVPTGHSMLWRLLSHLSLNYLSLADTENLKALLGLYIFSSNSGNTLEVANRKRIEGLSKITVDACDRLVSGIPMRGQSINVCVNPANYAGVGDMYLFGVLLDRLFSSFSSINCFTEFSMTDEVSEKTFSWPVRTGDRPLI